MTLPKTDPTPLNSGQIVQDYAKLVWSTADTLRGSGFKEGDWPKFMMPFFALALVESRILRGRSVALESFKDGPALNFENPEDRQDFIEEYHRNSSTVNGVSAGYHEDLVLHGQGLGHIVTGANPASFARTFQTYLSGFDAETKKLLGVSYQKGEARYLDIQAAIDQLESKTNKPLLAYTRKWSEMDLTRFDSSEITTLEEHLKRKWGDISHETSGEQYTPRDIIELMTSIVKEHFKRHPSSSGILDIYDPTCGGGNLVFGVEDSLRKAMQEDEHFRSQEGDVYSLQTFGQDFNDQLYALAAIEARFRPSATIHYGNTLTEDHFEGKQFDVIVANPPYGVDWKDFKADIENDQTGRFDARLRPPTSDGQHLFLQHIYHHLKDNGIALVLTSGSTLFSGDAGGGESNARSHYTLKEDGLHGVIQLPKNEFFNTGIATYLYFFWKGKPEQFRHKLFFLNAEDLFVKMRKSLGNKSNEISTEHASTITRLIARYEDSVADLVAKDLVLIEETATRAVPRSQIKAPALLRAVDVDSIHYNKVTLDLVCSGEGGALSAPMEMPKDSTLILAYFALKDGMSWSFFEHMQEERKTYDGNNGLQYEEEEEHKKAFLEVTDIKGLQRAVNAYLKDGESVLLGPPGCVFSWNTQTHELMDLTPEKQHRFVDKVRCKLECKLKLNKGKKGDPDTIGVHLCFVPDIQRDTETTPFSRDPKANQEAVAAFLKQWVRDPFEIVGEPVMGCEINFNRLFPKSLQTRSTHDILAEMATLNAQIAELDQARLSGGVA